MAPSDDLIAKHHEVQAAAKSVLGQLGSLITPADSEHTIAEKAYRLLCEHGFPDTWYYDCPAFVLAGSRSCLSILGRDYIPSEELVGSINLVSVDLSPERNGYWGDCARSFYIENGAVVEPTLSEFTVGEEFLTELHSQMQSFVNPDRTFQELFEWSNRQIRAAGFVNLDFLGNVGHSIAARREDRHYIDRGNSAKLGDVPFFTFEPHVKVEGGKWGFKHENIFYFDLQSYVQDL